MEAQTPALFQLFGGYLHQDFDLEYDSWQAAIRDFAENEPIDQVRRARDELAVLIDGSTEEDALSRFLVTELCCCLDPAQIGYQLTDWLRLVHQMIERIIHERRDGGNSIDG